MSWQACAEIVRRGDPERFLAVMTTPISARRVLFPIYAFNVEVARAPWVSPEPMIGDMRLQWWHDALEEIAKGASVRRHEVTTPLADVIDAAVAQSLQAVVEAHRQDRRDDGFSDMDVLMRYLDATGGTLMEAGARSLGVAATAADLRAVGRAAALGNWLRAVPALVARGVRPLPAVSDETLARLAARNLAELSAARRRLPRAAASVTRAAWLAGPTLRRAAQDPSRIRQGRLEVSEFSKRWRLLVRQAGGRP